MIDVSVSVKITSVHNITNVITIRLRALFDTIARYCYQIPCQAQHCLYDWTKRLVAIVSSTD